MMSESIIAHSKEIRKSVEKFELDYPMGSYIPSWKVFRVFTNENRILADQIVDTNAWNSKPRRILDIGSGDGLVLRNVLVNSNHKVDEIHLVEPNGDLLHESRGILNSLDFKCELASYETDILKCLEVLVSVDIVLISHVLYLLPEDSLQKILDHIPPDIPLIIITDDKNSLFPSCWKITAPKFHSRSLHIHNVINDLSSNFEVKSSKFQTYLQQPKSIKNVELRDKILSMISYSEYEILEKSDKIKIETTISKYTVKYLSFCNSIRYEIIKRV